MPFFEATIALLSSFTEEALATEAVEAVTVSGTRISSTEDNLPSPKLPLAVSTRTAAMMVFFETPAPLENSANILLMECMTLQFSNGVAN